MSAPAKDGATSLLRIDLDYRSGFRRFDDSIRHAQILKTVTSADQRLRFAPDHGGEVLDLPCERIGAFECDDLGFERFIPRPVFVPWVVLEAHRGHGERSAGADDHVRVL